MQQITKDRIIYLPLWFLSYFIQKDKDLYLCGGGGGFIFRGNPKFFYLYINKKVKDKKCIWITTNNNILKELEEHNLPVLNKYSLKGFWHILRAKYLIIEIYPKDITYIPQNLGKFNFIQTFHSITFKEIGIDKPNYIKANSLFRKIIKNLSIYLEKKTCKKYKLILSSSDIVSKLYKKAFQNKNLKITGFPRDDVLFDKNLAFRDYKKILNLKNYKRIILYARTFRDNQTKSPFDKEFFKKLNKRLEAENSILLVKKHTNDKDLIVPKLSNIKDVTQFVDDIQELLTITDTLITDYSGVAFDFSLLYKPTIFFIYDYNEYIKKCRNMTMDFLKEMPGPFINTENELLNYLFSVDKWFNEPKYQAKFKKYISKYHLYIDGNSSKRLENTLS
jgi:CDP-glycerol glycerophosphotransferase